MLSGRGSVATPPGGEDGAMYSNSSDSNYTNHTPSLASIYQVRDSQGNSDKYSSMVFFGETESDKKSAREAGEIQ